jgi:hypothetical protein
MKKTGWFHVPFLVDPNTSIELFEGQKLISISIKSIQCSFIHIRYFANEVNGPFDYWKCKP